jgi:hypothetical protein
MWRWFFLIIFIFLPSLVVANTLSNDKIWYFPKHEVSVGFYDNDFMPTSIPHPPHPFFWTSRTHANGGVSLNYEWLVYHTHKYFSVNFGTSLTDWVIHSNSEVGASFYFLVHVWLFRTETFSPYFDWSIGGPTLLSNRFFAQANLGGHFIFQDFLGFGAMMGRTHHVDLRVNIYHYSNGDLFVHNDGWDVPLVINIGYMFGSI